MSQRALLLAVRDKIQSTLGLSADSVEVGFDGHPKPSAGEQYIAVHAGQWSGQSNDYDLTEYLGCQVTLTRRLGYSPQDRYGIEVWLKATEGIEPVLRQIVVALHKQYDLLAIANETYLDLANNAGAGAFIEPLLFQSGGQPAFREYEWFSAPPPETDMQASPTGVSQTLTFGGARRVQGPADGGMT